MVLSIPSCHLQQRERERERENQSKRSTQVSQKFSIQLPLRRARIGADRGSGKDVKLLYPSSLKDATSPLVINQVRTKVSPDAPPHRKCHPPWCDTLPRGAWRWRQLSTLAFGAKSLVCCLCVYHLSNWVCFVYQKARRLRWRHQNWILIRIDTDQLMQVHGCLALAPQVTYM